MRRKKEIIHIVDRLNSAVSGTHGPMIRDEAALAETDRLAREYFQNTEVVYDEAMETRIAGQVLAHEERSRLIRVLFSRPFLVAASLFMIIAISVYVLSSYQRDSVAKRISSYIAFNDQALEFIVLNSMENVMQAALANRTDNSILDEQELKEKVAQSLRLYLAVHTEDDFINNNRELIDKVIDVHSADYINYIEANSQNTII
jgi:hypothetical protein